MKKINKKFTCPKCLMIVLWGILILGNNLWAQSIEEAFDTYQSGNHELALSVINQIGLQDPRTAFLYNRMLFFYKEQGLVPNQEYAQAHFKLAHVKTVWPLKTMWGRLKES